MDIDQGFMKKILQILMLLGLGHFIVISCGNEDENGKTNRNATNFSAQNQKRDPLTVSRLAIKSEVAETSLATSEIASILELSSAPQKEQNPVFVSNNGIQGDYLVGNFDIPLAINGQMSLTQLSAKDNLGVIYHIEGKENTHSLGLLPFSKLKISGNYVLAPFHGFGVYQLVSFADATPTQQKSIRVNIKPVKQIYEIIGTNKAEETVRIGDDDFIKELYPILYNENEFLAKLDNLISQSSAVDSTSGEEMTGDETDEVEEATKAKEEMYNNTSETLTKIANSNINSLP